MERPLTDWERRVLTRLAAIDDPAAALVRDSLPHLVVTGGCSCGCPSFDVRDVRFPQRPRAIGGPLTNGWTNDRSFGFVLLLGPDERPVCVDVFDNRPEGSPPTWPEPEALTVEPAFGK